MNIIETPKQSQTVLNYLNSENIYDWPIAKRYSGYEKCFLAFHPFLIVKPTGKDLKEPFKSFPKKSEIVENYDRLTWTEFLKISNIKDFKSLDDCLAFYHGARRFTDRYEFEKLINVTEKEDSKIIEAQVDYLPEIIEDLLLNFFLENGYSSLYVYNDIVEDKVVYNISELFEKELREINHIRIETTDGKMLVVEDFDQRFTYFLGSEKIIRDLVFKIDLEGFYCDDGTTPEWSYDTIDDKLKLNWNEKVKMHPNHLN